MPFVDRTRSLSVLLASGCVALVSMAPLVSSQQPTPSATPAPAPFVRTIERVTGELYKVQSGPANAAVMVFLVTPDGILLVDPLSPEFASWLKSELAMRFPGKPVKIVVESHFHYDHDRGGGIFSDTARFIGHENMPANLQLPFRQAPGPASTYDADGDNRLSRDEAQGGVRANFDRLDGNGDGFIEPRELYADTRRPDITFSDRYTVKLGAKRAELIYAKNRHSSDLFDVYFPDEKVLFAGDYIWPNRLCCNYAFDRRPMSTWINSIKALEDLDFEKVVASHWEGGTKSDFVRFRQYLEDLQASVATGIKAGKTLTELQKTITLDKYHDFAGYPEQLPATIQSAYESLTKY